MPFASVIAATDLTDRSAQVPGRARLLARQPGAQVLLAHVLPDEGKKRRNRDEIEAALTRVASDAGSNGIRVLSGESGAALSELATTEHAGLIVLGLHRERRVLDLLRLTTMERIVLAAPCPVLIAQLPPERPYRQVLLATDFSPGSAAALIAAAQLAPQAEFHAIHALEPGSAFSRGSRDSEAALEKAEAARDAFLQTPGLPALAEPPEIVPGGVHQVLAFRREELGADLICLGAQSGKDPQTLGNYARDLMRAPPTDVLVAKAP
ncbi:universal stress protein [Pararhodobacter zhoushanensis]|uniref:universal stress protein n=1 Tax=Pararhodobacter zhoushanensis TaxID=2479545 RepID=UPI000F8F08FB|nr:universal stress protein [Pararhodobacter zhoushanensis]